MSGLICGAPDLFGKRRVLGYGVGEITVRIADKATADALIRANHYSRSVVWSSSEHFTVHMGEQIIGALQFGPAMNPTSGDRVVSGSTPHTWLELNRMWLSDEKPENCATRAIAYALRVLRHERPAVEWVQSFADERCGKLGGVYQAASFLYLGSHVATFYELDGEWFHKSMKGRASVDKRGWGCGPKIAYFKENEHRAIPHTFRQFRYVKFINQKARKRLRMAVKPYPKQRAENAA